MKAKCVECLTWSNVNGMGVCETCLDEMLENTYAQQKGEEISDRELEREWRRIGFQVKRVTTLEV